MNNNKYTGMWVTATSGRNFYLMDDTMKHVDQEKSAYTGRYEITGDYIYYWD